MLGHDALDDAFSELHAAVRAQQPSTTSRLPIKSEVTHRGTYIHSDEPGDLDRNSRIASGTCAFV